MSDMPDEPKVPHLGEDDYRALFEGANDAIIVMDPETEETLVANQRAAELYGIPLSRLIGMSISYITKDKSRSHDLIRETMERGLYHRFETIQFHSDGSEIIIEVTASVVEFGGKQAILSINRDITGRKRAEIALRESREREALIARSLPAAVYLAPFGDSVDTTWIGPGIEKICGFDPQYFLDDPHFWRNRIHPEDRERVLDVFADSPLGSRIEVEYRWRVADGSYRWFFDTATVREGENNQREIMGTIVDVTAQHEIQQQLVQAQKMEAIGRLVGGLAHDFNNLLQGMMGASALCRLELNDPQMANNRLDEIDEIVGRGAQLTNQLLLISRNDMPVTTQTDLRSIVHDAQKLIDRLLRENIKVIFEADGVPIWVAVDRSQIHQVIMNLAINAADAMPEGGTLRIKTGITESDSAQLEVIDSGHGIPKGIRHRIFEPFFTTKSATRGTGLGLSVVHGIITRHGGKISLNSTKGQGAAFQITLPLCSKPDKVHGKDSANIMDGQGKGETILLVEDHDTVRNVIAGMLENHGYEVLPAESAEEALLIASGLSFNLLLSDFMLPGKSGHELAVQLRDRMPDLPLILMTGYATDELSKAADELPGLVILHKPVQPATLAHELRRILD